MNRLVWRLRAALILIARGWRPGPAWQYASALSSGPCDYFAEGYSPQDAVLEDMDCA